MAAASGTRTPRRDERLRMIKTPVALNGNGIPINAGRVSFKP